MTDTPFPPLAPITVPTTEGFDFPVRRIFCVGRNYADHVREMGGDPAREPPIFFTKPADAVVTSDGDTPYPPRTADLHHEVELVVAIGKAGRAIATQAALDHVWGYAVGIDLTRRDLQAAAKAGGNPWDMAKGFDHSAPIGDIVPASRIGHPASGAIALSVNGVVRQNGDISQMIWSVAEVIADLSAYVDLVAGDLIYTGTPAGIGPVQRGDRIEAEIAGVGRLHTTIV